MRFFSILKLALHNLKNNVLRTLLTVIVLGVVSFVVVFLAGVGYSFYESTNQNINAIIREEGAGIQFGTSIDNENYNQNVSNDRSLTLDDLEKLLQEIEKDERGLITSVSFFEVNNGYVGGTSSQFYAAGANPWEERGFTAYASYLKSNPFLSREDGYLDSGRMWAASDAGQKKVWMTVDNKAQYEVGDKISLYRQRQEYNSQGNSVGQPIKTDLGEFEITGFLDLGLDSSYGNGYLFLDYKYFDRFDGYVYASIIPQEGVVYGTETQNYLQSLTKSAGAIKLDQTGVSSGTKVIRAYSEVVAMLQMAFYMFLFVAGLVVIVSLIIVLLSIGSVANTIKISAEQNRKFFGVMKAIGMKNKSLRQILTLQIILMTVLGVAVASAGVYLAIGVAETLIASLIGMMFYQLAEPIIISTISPLIPIVVALLLIGIVLLFTRKNLSQFSRMDVISVINEVN